MTKPDEAPTESGASSNATVNDIAAKPTKRLKGKDRKAAKAQQTADETAHQAQTKQKKTYILRLASYVPLAKHIASSNSIHARVPRWVLAAIYKIIDDRSECLQYFMGDIGEGKDSTDNENHAYMIRILKEVANLLKVKSKQAFLSQKSKRPTHLKTAFEGLAVEDTNDEDDGNMAVPTWDEKVEAEAEAWKETTGSYFFPTVSSICVLTDFDRGEL